MEELGINSRVGELNLFPKRFSGQILQKGPGRRSIACGIEEDWERIRIIVVLEWYAIP